MNIANFISKAKDIAANYKTLYVMGCFGAPLTGTNVERYKENHSYNQAAARQAMIDAVANQSPPYYGFDCVCLIKGILWGWCGDSSKTYGGATYNSNSVPDISADQMIAVCSSVSTSFAGIVPGAAVWCSGHIGIYIGNGLAVECTPSFENKVQVTAVANLGAKSGYSSRTWTKWGKLPYIDYTITTVDDAVTMLEALGVINSPDQWLTAANSGKVQYLDLLLIKAANGLDCSGTRTNTPEEGIATMVSAGVIDSPDHWLSVYGSYPNLDLLLCALGGAAK